MKLEVLNISGKDCYLYCQPDAKSLLIQPVDEHDLELLSQEVEVIQTLTSKPFSLVAFNITAWNQDLSPWPAPPVFGKNPFGDGAKSTLAFIEGQLLPQLQQRGVNFFQLLLGGYSLAGLFSLWASYQTNKFDGIVAASPSVWFPDWLNYIQKKKPFAKYIYLSLGDKEEKAKNPLLAQVGDAIRKQEELLRKQDVNTMLEWNQGNHFVDSEKRMAKGFAWLLNDT